MVSVATVIVDVDFDREVLKVDKPVLVYFWADWCGPCRLVTPAIDRAAGTYGERLKVVKIEVDPNPYARGKCKVEGVPALRLFKDNELLSAHEGAITWPNLQVFLDTYL